MCCGGKSLKAPLPSVESALPPAHPRRWPRPGESKPVLILADIQLEGWKLALTAGADHPNGGRGPRRLRDGLSERLLTVGRWSPPSSRDQALRAAPQVAISHALFVFRQALEIYHLQALMAPVSAFPHDLRRQVFERPEAPALDRRRRPGSSARAGSSHRADRPRRSSGSASARRFSGEF